MNKIQKLIIFMLLFAYINSTCNSNLDEESGNTVLDQLSLLGEFTYSDNTASASECKKRAISDYERKELMAYKCCYIKCNCKVNIFLKMKKKILKIQKINIII